MRIGNVELLPVTGNQESFRLREIKEFEILDWGSTESEILDLATGQRFYIQRKKIDPKGLGDQLYAWKDLAPTEQPTRASQAPRPPALRSEKPQDATGGQLQNKCDVKPPQADCFSFSAENLEKVKTPKGLKSVGGNCKNEMLGYTINEPAKGRQGKLVFGYSHGFCGPTCPGNCKWSWGRIGKEERAWCYKIAQRCKINLPAQKDKWLGVEGMKCLVKEVVAKLPSGSFFEIDNASHLLPPYNDQYHFVKKFSQLMKESGIYDKHMVMKNINKTEAERIVADTGPGKGICSSHLSNFVINEENFLKKRDSIQNALACGGFSIAQSVDTTRYGFSDGRVSGNFGACGSFGGSQVAQRSGQK